jgi:hypothetical protein
MARCLPYAQAADQRATIQQPTSTTQLVSVPTTSKRKDHNGARTRTFIPSLNPSSLPNVPSTSTPATSCSCLGPDLRVCERMPVHPKKTDCCLPGLPSLPAACLKLSSTTTFCAKVFAFDNTLTSDDGRLSKQFLRLGKRATSAWDEAGGLRGAEAIVLLVWLPFVISCVLESE